MGIIPASPSRPAVSEVENGRIESDRAASTVRSTAQRSLHQLGHREEVTSTEAEALRLAQLKLLDSET